MRWSPAALVQIAVWLTITAISVLRFCWLSADFPNYSQWMVDQAKFTDEGWWSQGAVMHQLLGHWNVPGDYNPAVATPVWPMLLGLVFHFTGVSVVAARSLNAAISVATLGVVYLLARRYTTGGTVWPAMMAVALLATSPFAFVFSRLSILETSVIFEFCLLLLVASYVSAKRRLPLILLSLLIPAVILTKTTAIVLLPAVVWLVACRLERTIGSFVRAALAVMVVPALVLKGYVLLVAALGYGDDYSYFFSVNAMGDIDWSQTLGTLRDLFVNCFWVDRILYPFGIAVLLVSLVWKRRLWRNPLYTASWIAFAAQTCFIFRRQDDYAPRYFLMMLVPLVLIAVIALAELQAKNRKISSAVWLVMAICVAANTFTIGRFMLHRQFQYTQAAASIRQIIQSEPKQSQLMLGVSASQLSLMTGIPSINDAYGTDDLAQKITRSQPGWYVAWNGVGTEIQTALSPRKLQQVASYPVFDDDDRNMLILYRIVPGDEPRPEVIPHQ
jgi:hypothetical protein